MKEHQGKIRRLSAMSVQYTGNLKQPNPRRVAVFGLGYVGCVTAACLAEIGHSVAGVDHDLHKVHSVDQGRAPFAEPDLSDLVSANVAAGRLRAVASAAEGLDDADVALLCVGTNLFYVRVPSGTC